MQTDLGPSVVVEIRCILLQDKLPWFPAVTHMTLHGDKQHGGSQSQQQIPHREPPGDMEDVGVTMGTTTLLLVVEDHSTRERHRDSECVVEIA